MESENTTSVSKFLVSAYCSPTLQNNSWTFKDNCVMKIYENGDFKLLSSDESHEYIVANIGIDGIEIVHVCENDTEKYDNSEINLTFKFKGECFGIQFSSRSNESEKIFMEKYKNVVLKKNHTEYYESGNIKMEGPYVSDNFNGECVKYFDTPHKKIMIEGTFEDGIPDGTCDCYSENGVVAVKCNNVCNGVPNGVAHVYINGEKKHTIDFDEIKVDYDITEPTFAHDLCSDVDFEYEKNADKLAFKHKTVDERIMFIYDELEKLKTIEPKNTNENFMCGTNFSHICVASILAYVFYVLAYLKIKYFM